MKKFSFTNPVLWICLGVISGYVVLWIIPEYLRAREDPRSEARLSRIAAEINRSVPVMVDQETELLPAVGAFGMLIYNYRLVSYSVTQVNVNKFAAGAKERVMQGACEKPETRNDFLSKGVTLRYSYYDKDKHHIATFDVTPADCGF